MKRIFIDVTRLIARRLKGKMPTGIDRVGLAYVRHFAERSQAVIRCGPVLLLLSPAASLRLFRLLQEREQASRWQLLPLLGGASVVSARSGKLRDQIVVNTGHSGLEAPNYVRRTRRRQLRPLLMVHDLIPITHPEYCRAGEKVRHMARMDNLLAAASGVIANSRATLDELAAYARGRGLCLPPSRAIPLAPASLPPPASERPMAQPYFVVLSTIEPRKNHSMLLEVWRQLVARLPAGAAPRLLVVGQRGWESQHTIALLERSEAIRSVVIERGNCDDRELATYLHHAQALLFPSFAEGYGLPLVEALAPRVPVIASDLPAFREIVGDIPEYLDPIDGAGWLRMVQDYADPGSARRQAQCRRLAGFVAPTWEEHFAGVDRFIEELA